MQVADPNTAPATVYELFFDRMPLCFLKTWEGDQIGALVFVPLMSPETGLTTLRDIAVGDVSGCACNWLNFSADTFSLFLSPRVFLLSF